MSYLLEELNDKQLSAVTHTNGPLMILAGAGTGKTTVITRRIAWLIEQGIAKPEELLALTFTDKASGEMEERVDMLLPYGYLDLQVSTFHSFCEKLLREFGVQIGLQEDFRVASELDAWLVVLQNLDSFKLDYYKPMGNPKKYIRSLLRHFARAKDTAITPQMYALYAQDLRLNQDCAQANAQNDDEVARVIELSAAYTQYQKILIENDLLDFGDLILFTLQLLEKRSNVLRAVQDKYRYVLVDEFQDTNSAQYEIVKLIAGKSQNVTVVGDDDQAIYKFRGASVENILRFETDFPTAKKIVLTDNYRSTQPILDKAHSLIQSNTKRLENNDDCLSKKLKANVFLGSEIHHEHCRDLDDETKFIVEKILSLKARYTDVTFNDFAVLVRANSAGDAFADAFDKHGIPFQFLALSGLYQKPVVLDVLALLRAIDDPYDGSSLYRVLSLEMWNLEPSVIAELTHFSKRKGKSLFNALENFISSSSLEERSVIILEKIYSFLQKTKTNSVNSRVSETVVRALQDSGYIEYLNSKNERDSRESYNFLRQFFSRVKGFEVRAEHPVLHNFLVEFCAEQSSGEEGSLDVDLNAGPDMVRVMTIHAAKGLEFRFVFIANMVEQRFPTSRKSDPIPLPVTLVAQSLNDANAHLEEERRLFYVAMTRAKQGLYFTSAQDYGGVRKRKISRFLVELGFEQSEKKKQPVNVIETPLPEFGNTDKSTTQFRHPKRFSFTQLAAFRNCPLQYKFAHILQVPVFGKWTSSFGKTMHNTLHEFFKAWMERAGKTQKVLFSDIDENTHSAHKTPVSWDELVEIYNVCWQDEWYTNDTQREEYRKEGKSQLKKYFNYIKENPPSPIYLEQAFTLKFSGVILKGQIDRIDEVVGGVEIIDYKTGAPKKDGKLGKEDKEQLILYQIATREILKLTPVKLTFLYLQDNSKVSFIATQDEIEELKSDIVDRVSKIKQSSFPPNPGFHCNTCDFKDICEYRQT